jgi:phosphoribosylanthranilate isomerase
MTQIKICGITNSSDAKAAIASGANFIGLVFTLESKRFIPKAMAKKIIENAPFNHYVAVFRNQPKSEIEEFLNGLPIQTIQLHGEETPAFCNYFLKRGLSVIKSFPISEEIPLEKIKKFDKCNFILLDRHDDKQAGGTGKSFDWKLLAGQDLSRVFVSGGLDPKNITDLLKHYQPFGVDVSTGVERSPGMKDSEKIQSFIENVRQTVSS